MSDGVVFVGTGAVFALVLIITWRWLARVQDQVDDHAERIARLEGRRDDHDLSR